MQIRATANAFESKDNRDNKTIKKISFFKNYSIYKDYFLTKV